MEALEQQIAEWRAYVEQGRTLDDSDVDELETHLRDQIADLSTAGLGSDEAFLVAVKRMGNIDRLTREFAREHSDRLWKQLVLSVPAEQERSSTGLREALLFAVATAVAIQVARLAAGWPGDETSWLLRNVSLLVFPFLAGYFIVQRKLPFRQIAVTLAPFVLAGLVINLYPYDPNSSTEPLVMLHLPVALWFVVAYAYMGGARRWCATRTHVGRSAAGRCNHGREGARVGHPGRRRPGPCWWRHGSWRPSRASSRTWLPSSP